MSEFTDKDFQAIEAAVLETERGRWFLSEFARRNRMADTDTLLAAMRRLETAVVRQPAAVASGSDTDGLLQIITDTESAIARIRNDLAADAGPIPAEADVHVHLATMARRLSEEISFLGEQLQTAASRLGDSEDKSIAAEEITSLGEKLQAIGYSHDVLSQRIGKAMTLLGHIRAQLERDVTGGQQTEPAPLSAETLAFFAMDEHLFASDEPERPDATAAEQSVEPHTEEPAQDAQSSAAEIRADLDEGTAVDEPSGEEPTDDAPAMPVVEAEPATEADEAVAASLAETTETVEPASEPAMPEVTMPLTKTDRDRIVIIRSGGGGPNIPLADEPASTSNKAL